MLLGAPSPLPMTGVTISGALRLSEIWSAHVDLRIVFSPNRFGDRPIQAVNEGISAAACLSRWRFFLCPFGFHVGLIHYKPGWRDWFAPVPAVGPALKAGYDLSIGERLSVRFVGDFVVPLSPIGLSLGVGDKPVWTGPQVMGSLGGLLMGAF